MKCQVRGNTVLRGTITEEGCLGRAATKMHSTSGERNTSFAAGDTMETIEWKVKGGEEADHGICPRRPSPFPAYDIPAEDVVRMKERDIIKRQKGQANAGVGQNQAQEDFPSASSGAKGGMRISRECCWSAGGVWTVCRLQALTPNVAEE